MRECITDRRKRINTLVERRERRKQKRHVERKRGRSARACLDRMARSAKSTSFCRSFARSSAPNPTHRHPHHHRHRRRNSNHTHIDTNEERQGADAHVPSVRARSSCGSIENVSTNELAAS